MNYTIHWQATAQDRILYVDFQIEGIDGVFRAAKSGGVDLEKTIDRITANTEFFNLLCNSSVREVLQQSTTSTNWGGGWQWRETFHPALAEGFTIDHATSWFTVPFNGKDVQAEPMEKLHRVEADGIELLYSWNPNRQPSVVAYFFPLKKPALSVASC